MSNDGKALRIKSVEYAGDGYVLRLRWTNGASTNVDLSEPVNRLKGLRPLRERNVFARAKVGEGGHSVAWPSDLDMGADRLWEIALEQSGRADTVAFIRWRQRHGLSLAEAAAAIGVSRRTVAYYVSGEQEVPRYILLACKGWETERRAPAGAAVA